jgi:hypothetical protein
VPPCYELSPRLLVLPGSLTPGEVVSRRVKITNHSRAPLCYSFEGGQRQTFLAALAGSRHQTVHGTARQSEGNAVHVSVVACCAQAMSANQAHMRGCLINTTTALQPACLPTRNWGGAIVHRFRLVLNSRWCHAPCSLLDASFIHPAAQPCVRGGS